MSLVEGKQFWLALDKFTGIRLPQSLKSILSLCGYDNPLSFTRINRYTFHLMRKYMAKTRGILIIPPGNKELILQLVQLAKRNYNCFISNYCTVYDCVNSNDIVYTCAPSSPSFPAQPIKPVLQVTPIQRNITVYSSAPSPTSFTAQPIRLVEPNNSVCAVQPTIPEQHECPAHLIYSVNSVQPIQASYSTYY